MNITKVISEFKKRYPDKNIIVNSPEFPLEVICELDPVAQTKAVAVIDFARPHYHRKNTEIYEVIQGELIVYLQGETIRLRKGERVKIKPLSIHSAVGKETWINVYSDPGWTLEDHILIKNVRELQEDR